MIDKTYTEKEAYALLYHEQKALLDKRGIIYKSNIKEDELVKLILKTNPSKINPTLTITLAGEEINKFKEILNIARAGFPRTELIIFINDLQTKLK